MNRPVVVKRLPERLDEKGGRHFYADIHPILNTDRPQVVFDCSPVTVIDAAGVELLLRCLHLVMRHDGDLKLAAVSPQMALLLDLTRTERLFEIYESSSDAALSFSQFLPAAMRGWASFPPEPFTLEQGDSSAEGAAA